MATKVAIAMLFGRSLPSVESVSARLAIPTLSLVYLARCAHFNYVADDAFISFRYARNLARGLGLVFNPGERVEGYTNFLMVVVLAGVHRAGGDIVVLGRALSVLCGVGMVAATASLGNRSSGSMAIGGASGLLVAINPFVAVWGGSGLETTAFGFLLLLMLMPLTDAAVTRRKFCWSSACGLALALTRPEGVIVYAVVGLFLLLTSDSLPHTGRKLAPGFLIFVVFGTAYFVWRSTYFHAALPNTFVAKSNLSFSQARQGLAYLAGFVVNPFILAMVVLSVEGARSSRAGRLLSVVLCSIALVVILEGGDGLPMYRFFVPAVPLVAVLAMHGMQRALSRVAHQWRRDLIASGTVVAVAALSLFPRHDDQFTSFVNQRDYEVPAWRAAALTLKTALPNGALVAAVPVGALGWYSDLRVLDMLGLTDRAIARTRPDRAIRWPGHQKHDGEYVIARRPAAILLGNIRVDASPDWPGPLSELSDVFRAREGDVSRNPSFASMYKPVTLPAGTGMYLHFYLRRDVELR